MHCLNKRYVLIKQLGRGGMGVVYKAMDSQLGNRFVAVKEMSQRHLTAHEVSAATTAFRHEAHLLASLSHQNLPRIYDYFSENGSSFLVMDFIEGETLADLFLQANGQGLLVEEVLLIAEQLCSVLTYLHGHFPPIIFRDIKPANVMLTAQGDHLYLIDFGIARLFKTGQLKDTLAFGTVGYAPPEQYGSLTTQHSDTYSLGVTLHQLLTGLDPTQSKTPFSFPPIHLYNQHVPPLLEALIMQMVETDTVKRPVSMNSVKQRLQHIRQQMYNPVSDHLDTNTFVGSTTSPLKVASGTTHLVYKKHTDSIHLVAWAPDGKYLASCSRDKTVHVWDATSGNNVFTYKNHSSFVYGLAWSPDSQRIVSTSFANAHIWNATTGDNKILYGDHSLWVYSAAWSQNAMLIATAGADGEVHIWDARTGKAIYKYQGYPKAIRTVAWSNGLNSTRVVCGCEDTNLYSWDITKKNAPMAFQGHKREISCVAWSPDDSKVASSSRDKTVKIWDASSGNVLSTYQGHTKDVHAVAWSPDGTRIASAGEDRTVRVWNVATGAALFVYQGHTREAFSLSWSPDGTRIASAGEDKTVRVWQV